MQNTDQNVAELWQETGAKGSKEHLGRKTKCFSDLLGIEKNYKCILKLYVVAI